MNIKNNKDLEKYRKENKIEYCGNKCRGFKRFFNSFKFAFQGFKYAFKNEQNLFVHVIILIFVIFIGCYFKISLIEWLFILVMIGMVLATEFINTSIEATIDLYSKRFHPLAKIAKDTGSAAVLSLAVISIVGSLIIFVPYIIEKWF